MTSLSLSRVTLCSCVTPGLGLTPTCFVCSAPTSAVCCTSRTQSACTHKYSPSCITYTVNLQCNLSGITYTVHNIQLAYSYIHKCSLSCIMYSCLTHTNTVYLASCKVGLHTQMQSVLHNIQLAYSYIHKCSLSCIMYSWLTHTNTVCLA